ncbi:hypothetical protein KIN20_011657 [Parelaphostrongylus tenuis]|uniref:Uncharacterized protein n=1 Tax=Parelaphostrongylus tenuis TaxID=148309 RepID=A0AAD5MED8_PARTN|nr:hypothetical protein KIN20_011657 [Parelaphostrongylus tenuis]
MAPRFAVFRCCFLSDSATDVTEPYELARCEPPAALSEVSLPASFADGRLEKKTFTHPENHLAHNTEETAM